MNIRNALHKLSFLVTGAMIIVACDSNQVGPEQEQLPIPLAERVMPPDFNYTTKKDVEVDIIARNSTSNGLGGVKLSSFSLEEDGKETELFSGITNSDGIFKRSVELSASLDPCAWDGTPPHWKSIKKNLERKYYEYP